MDVYAGGIVTGRKDRRLFRRSWLVALALWFNVSAIGVRAQDGAREIASAPAIEAPAEATPSESPSGLPPQQAPAGNSANAPAERQVSERQLPANFLHDQKDLWLFPVQLAHGHHWLPTLVVIGVTSGLLALDAHDTAYFRRTSSFNGFNRVFAGNITMSEILVTPGAFYVAGLIGRDSYAKNTGLLAAEALADSTVLSVVMKGVTRRLRPSDIPPQGNFSDTFFRARQSPFSTSFPSGHTIAAFSVATVVARRYGAKHRWVPWVAYGVGGIIGFSRVTLQAHFPSDVFLGAALGYAIARFDVLREN